jgi:hypothetical protein
MKTVDTCCYISLHISTEPVLYFILYIAWIRIGYALMLRSSYFLSCFQDNFVLAFSCLSSYRVLNFHHLVP